MKAFVALDLDDGLRAAAMRIRDRLERSPASPKKPRFSSEEKLHLTLKFLGEIDESHAQTIASGIESVVTKAPSLAWSALDAFPSKTNARVIILAMEDDGTLGPLASSIEDQADGILARGASSPPWKDALGIEREARPYRPHVTLARLENASNVTDWLGTIEPARGVATALTLYESKGGKYIPIARFPLTVSTGSR